MNPTACYPAATAADCCRCARFRPGEPPVPEARGETLLIDASVLRLDGFDCRLFRERVAPARLGGRQIKGQPAPEAATGVDYALAERLYRDHRWTLAEIGRLLDRSRSAVGDQLRRRGVQTRIGGWRARKAPPPPKAKPAAVRQAPTQATEQMVRAAVAAGAGSVFWMAGAAGGAR